MSSTPLLPRTLRFRRRAGHPGLSLKTGDGAYVTFIAFYAVCFAVTWAMFIRRTPGRLDGV